jgi:hypothetical protein
VNICSIALEACEAILALGYFLRAADPTEETTFVGSYCVNPYVALFEEHGIVGMLPDLADSQDDAVSSRASWLREYFDAGYVSADSGATRKAAEPTAAGSLD